MAEDTKHVLDLQAKWNPRNAKTMLSLLRLDTHFYSTCVSRTALISVLACLSVFADLLAHLTGIVFNSVVMYGL